LVAAGCATSSELLEPSFVQQIHEGQDRSEIRKLLGPPNWSRGGTAGETADTYIYTEVVFSSTSASSSARDLKVRAFSIRYDVAGHVRETLFHESRTPAVLLRHSAYAGPNITAQDISSIRTGITTREQLETKFQKPLVVNLHPVRGLELHWYQIEVGASVTHLQDEQGLHVLVDEQGIVRNAESSSTSDRHK
jgi:outer membrane protein assembly factor BamE (lipoprotein component of BamABCDE complex)